MQDHPEYQARPAQEAEPELDHWPTTDELIGLSWHTRKIKGTFSDLLWWQEPTGWPADLRNDEILRRLLALNLERTEKRT